MPRALTLGAIAVAALCILGNCADDSQDSSDGADTAASPSAPAAATSSRSTPPSEHTVAPSPTTQAPPPRPPLDIVPLHYVGDVADEPARPALPELPPAGTVRAAVEVRGGWSGSFVLDGSDPRVSVTCGDQPNPRAGIDVYALNYMATSEAGTSEYGLPDGGWALRFTRIGPLGYPGGLEVSLTAVTADGDAWEMPGFGTEAEPDIAAAGPPDNSAIAFAYRGVAQPQFLSGDSSKITWVTVTGTVSCAEPLPDLTWGDG